METASAFGDCVCVWLCSQSPLKLSPKGKLNDLVHVLHYCGVYDKGYLSSWLEEYYEVIKIENTKLPLYKLCDMQGEGLTGMFYGHELPKILVTPTPRTELKRFLKQRGAMLFAGWPNKFTMWIPSKNVLHA